MRSKELLKNLKKALQQDYLYDSTELKFMKEQLSILEKEIEKNREKNSKAFEPPTDYDELYDDDDGYPD